MSDTIKSIENLLNAHERLKHRDHQLVGTDQLVRLTDLSRTATAGGVTYRREIPGVFALLDEVGAGKTKQNIDAAQILYLQRSIDTIITLTPGFARSTWADEDAEIGEVAKHAWASVPNVVHEFHGSYTDLDISANALHWIVSNYEFIRQSNRLEQLIEQTRGRRVWLIVDESWAVKGNSQQTKAVLKLRRRRADRVTILNGTPLADGKPSDLYYQFKILDEDIIGCKTRAHFRAKYCVVDAGSNRVVDYQNLDELNARIAPYVLSRRTRDCFDLPPMLPPVTIEARLSPTTWKIYREMRDDLVAFLGDEVSMSKVAMTKAMRLAQITSGFLGGLEAVAPTGPDPNAMPDWLAKAHGLPLGGQHEDPTVRSQAQTAGSTEPADFEFEKWAATSGDSGARFTREVGREKLDAFFSWLDSLPALPDKLIVWCRFTPELERLVKEIGSPRLVAGKLRPALYDNVLELRGGQSDEVRRGTKKALAPGALGRAAVVGNQGAGGASLNFSAANIMIFCSNDPALIKRTQAIGRIERPGASQPMLIGDVMATGPKGQKTIDHHLIKSLRSKDDMARWTVGQWRAILVEE